MDREPDRQGGAQAARWRFISAAGAVHRRHRRSGRGGAAARGPVQAGLRPRIPSEALAEGGAAIAVFTISAQVADSLFEAAGKKAAAVQSALDARPSPASFAIPDTRVDLHVVVSERKRANSYNVVGMIEGSDPVLKNETVIFSGHFDHDGIGPQGILHGADDNGSGTVGVVELARAFAMNPSKPRRSL